MKSQKMCVLGVTCALCASVLTGHHEGMAHLEVPTAPETQRAMPKTLMSEIVVTMITTGAFSSHDTTGTWAPPIVIRSWIR